MGENEPRALMGKRIVWTDQAKADIRGIEQPIAIRILKTLGRYLLSGEGITPPLIRLRAQNHRVFFRDKGETIEIVPVLRS